MNWNQEFLADLAPTLEEFRGIFPTQQSTHTGLWGWQRRAGCVNLNACSFATEAEAAADRDRAFARPDSYPMFSR
jgi:hypothetical protein